MNGFDSDGYWAKAQLFVNRSMESPTSRSEDERRLWASLALEQLAKWALAKTSPTLVADPSRIDGDQLFRALGLVEGGPYLAVTASTAFKRCAAIYRPFNEKDASTFASARNEYLHGTEIALLRIPSEAWWSRFWSLCNVLLTAHQLGPGDLVGWKRSTEVESHLSRNTKRVEHQCEAALDAARRSLARYRDGHILAAEAHRWERGGINLGAGESYQAVTTCPACGDFGTAESEVADDEQTIWPGDPEDLPVREVTWTPDYFSCTTCHLVLDSYELVVQAGLVEALTTEEEWDYDEAEYGND